ncbi:MAG TPA: hypothetical protein VF618_22005 [Thermoanaerobaculia bacterium]
MSNRLPTRLSITAVLALSFALCSTSAFAEIFSCGTKDAVIRRDEQVAKWSAARREHLMAKGFKPGVNATVRDFGTVVLPADDFTAPFFNPVDLQGKTIHFTRKDNSTFTATVGPLQFDSERGPRLNIQSPTGASPIDLQFEFPFFDEKVKKVYPAANNGIFLSFPGGVAFEQFSDLELASLRQPVIAPLLATSTAQPSPASTFARQTADSLTVTWAQPEYEVQAKLFANGDIRFSYNVIDEVPSGALVITSGKEAWRDARSVLGQKSDPVGDVTNAPSTFITAMTDIENVTVNRIANSDLLEFRIDVAGPIEKPRLGGSPLLFVVAFDNATYALFEVSRTGDNQYQIPGWGLLTNSNAARLEGDQVVFNLTEELLPPNVNQIAVFTQWGETEGDSAFVDVNLGSAAVPIRTDFSKLTSADFSRPILESFTVPVLSVNAVWETLRAAYNLDPADWDGVAIYQNFYTDIIYYAGAYSTVGNPQVDGISTRSTMRKDRPRSPALLHMNKVAYGVNMTEQSATHVVLHELGHRWLLHIDIKENGTRTRALNPISAHPAQYVHTPAPYQVFSKDDSSVMGGATFTDNGNGTFNSPPYSSYSYSYLDLYLMGLIPGSDVRPWFYIAESNPTLGGAYYPPPARTFAGKRRDVTIDNVVEAMGPRDPAWPNTQRQFRVLTVLMADPSREPTASEIALVTRYRRLLEQGFSIATGNRGHVTTQFPVPEQTSPRRRTTRP